MRLWDRLGGLENPVKTGQNSQREGGDERKQHENVKLKEENVPILPLSWSLCPCKTNSKLTAYLSDDGLSARISTASMISTVLGYSSLKMFGKY